MKPAAARPKSVVLPEEHLAALEEAKAEDGVPLSTRLRAMVQLWASDPVVRAQVDELAKKLRAQGTEVHRSTVAKARQARWPGTD